MCLLRRTSQYSSKRAAEQHYILTTEPYRHTHAGCRLGGGVGGATEAYCARQPYIFPKSTVFERTRRIHTRMQSVDSEAAREAQQKKTAQSNFVFLQKSILTQELYTHTHVGCRLGGGVGGATEAGCAGQHCCRLQPL